jgi:hypothetical protein
VLRAEFAPSLYLGAALLIVRSPSIGWSDLVFRLGFSARPSCYSHVPVRIASDPVAAKAQHVAQHIDIRLPSGVVISVGVSVEVEALRRVLTALAGR